jgi:uncharacterized protein YqjF (DUF2071 family)
MLSHFSVSSNAPSDPSQKWIMKQTWNDLLFAHWPVPVEKLREHVPSSIEIDTFDGYAWIGVVPFWMSNVRPAYLPAVPYLSTFPELNVRTYIYHHEKPGVYFFSLDATQWLAVELARKLYHLNYLHANITYGLQNKNTVMNYHSIRKDRRAAPAQLDISYQPTSAPFVSHADSIEHWLTERYCLYVMRNHKVSRVDIGHSPWLLQQAEADIRINSMNDKFQIHLPDRPQLLHYSKKLDVTIYPIIDMYNS